MNLFKAIATAAVLTAPLCVEAATFDFAQIANDYKYYAADSDEREGSYNQVVAGLGAGVFTNGGVSIVGIAADGSNGPSQNAHPFFDGSGSRSAADNGNNLAGLGVCSSGFDDQIASWSGASAPENYISECSSNGGADASDDNIKLTEFVGILFDRKVGIVDSFWRDASHNAFSGLLDYESGGGGIGTLTIANGFLTGVNGGDGIDSFLGIAFRVNANSTPDNEVYLSLLTVAPVPLPAGFVLMGTALAGFGALRRRKTHAS